MGEGGGYTRRLNMWSCGLMPYKCFGGVQLTSMWPAYWSSFLHVIEYIFMLCEDYKWHIHVTKCEDKTYLGFMCAYHFMSIVFICSMYCACSYNITGAFHRTPPVINATDTGTHSVKAWVYGREYRGGDRMPPSLNLSSHIPSWLWNVPNPSGEWLAEVAVCL